MTLRDFIQLWTDYSHRKNIERLCGVTIADAGQAAELVAQLAALNWAARPRAVALVRQLLRQEGEAPRPGAVDRLVFTALDGDAAPLVYSAATSGGSRWRGINHAGGLSASVDPDEGSEYHPAGGAQIGRYFSHQLARMGLSSAQGADMAELIDRYVAWNAKATAILDPTSADVTARKLAATCRKVGCQRRAAAALFVAYGRPDPTPFLENSDGPSRFAPRLGLIVTIQKAGVPAHPGMLLAKTSSNLWRYLDDAASGAATLDPTVDSTHSYCPTEAVREFLVRLVTNLTVLFGGAAPALGASTPPAESATNQAAA